MTEILTFFSPVLPSPPNTPAQDFLASLEVQERDIRLMSSHARRERAVQEEHSEARDKKQPKKGKTKKKKAQGAMESGGMGDNFESGIEGEGMEEGMSLMDASWNFAEGSAMANLDYGSRPGTSAGGHGGSRGGGTADGVGGLSRGGHTSSSRILPIDEEFGNGDPLVDIPVNEVDDEC